MRSDGALWIRTVCEEILPGWKTTFILDLYHALEYASAALKPYRDRFEAVAVCIRYYEANRDRMRFDLCRARGPPVGSGIVESACNCIVGNRLKGAGRTGRKRAPTACSPSDAASKTGAGPTSSIGGLAASQPHNQKKWGLYI